MSRALMVRSIPLALTTRDAWKENGAMFAKRTSDDRRIAMLAEGGIIINLGSSTFSLTGSNVWNERAVIEPLLTPAMSRTLLGSLLPSNRYEGPNYYWLKGAGRGGANKTKVFIRNSQEHAELWSRAGWTEGDVQLHIDGDEYRVITVGEKVVQVMKRTGGHMASDRVYTWVGVQGCDSIVKAAARKAAMKLANSNTIIGWDVIDNGRAYILEGNSCPGVNVATAGRILNAVEGRQYN